MKAAVPEPWVTAQDEDGEVVYKNAETGGVMYDHPLDEEFKQRYQAEKEKRKVMEVLEQKAEENLSLEDFLKQNPELEIKDASSIKYFRRKQTYIEGISELLTTQLFTKKQKRSVHETYKVGKELGKGGFGKVYLANRLSDNQDFAIKFLKKASMSELDN